METSKDLNIILNPNDTEPVIVVEESNVEYMGTQGTAEEWSEKLMEKFPKVFTERLGHFDVNKKTILMTDASGAGLGAVLIQVVDKEESVIEFASRRLQGAEWSYSAIEKEALACCWGINHYRYYLWGLPFVLRTDPLLQVFKCGRGLEGSMIPRISRWLINIIDFNFDVEFVRGKKNVVADCLSRMPIDEYPEEASILSEIEVEAFLIDDELTLKQEEWEDAMVDDKEYDELKKFISDGPLAGKEVPCLPLSPEVLVILNIPCSNQYGPLVESRRTFDCATHLQPEVCVDDNIVAKLPPNMGRLSPSCGEPDLASILQKLDEVKSLVQLLMNQLMRDLTQKCANVWGTGVLPAPGGLPTVNNVPESRPKAGKHQRGLSTTSPPESSPASDVEGYQVAPATVNRKHNIVIKDRNTSGLEKPVDYTKGSWGGTDTQVPAGVANHTKHYIESSDDAVCQDGMRRSVHKELGRGLWSKGGTICMVEVPKLPPGSLETHDSLFNKVIYWLQVK
ncbi:hypothetical protein NDU88_002248 [Pleurodeles waltl]|uniref:Reverse transcriptase RNase H-like domain-containing protein n=1 Tax=Pleurodeles waltl TaxID=8319 RepID=A0AAV7UWK5_PLEWA|nr:hypothetical protein NDU88_002248 [Pleurodeles waltl]